MAQHLPYRPHVGPVAGFDIFGPCSLWSASALTLGRQLLCSRVPDDMTARFRDFDSDFFGNGPPSYGRHAYITTCYDVGAYSEQTSPLNRYQVVLIDRSDLRVGDFDVELNYEYINWFWGDSSSGDYPGAGYDWGDGVHSYNMPGVLSSNVSQYVTNSNLNPPIPGRYIFRMNSDINLAQVTSIAAANAGNVFCGSSAWNAALSWTGSQAGT